MFRKVNNRFDKSKSEEFSNNFLAFCYFWLLVLLCRYIETINLSCLIHKTFPLVWLNTLLKKNIFFVAFSNEW